MGIMLAALVVSWAAVAFLGWLLYLTVRQQGRVLLAHEELRTRLAGLEAGIQRIAERPVPALAPAPTAAQAAPAQALSVGSPAPEFQLPDLSGRLRTLADYRGRPALLLFFNPACGFCTQLAPKLRDLPQRAPQLLVMSRGEVEVNRQLAREHGWKGDVLLEPSWEVATTYRTNATPTAYLVDAQGRIGSGLAVGEDAVLQLTRVEKPPGNGAGDLTLGALHVKQAAAEDRARAAGLALTQTRINRDGLPAGTPAPNFKLRDLSGRYRALTDFRGKRILLVFSDPGCGPCQALAPSLEELHRLHRDNNLQVLMVSKGDPRANREKVKEQGLTFPVVLQKNWEISKDYAMFATPVGYLIDELGVIQKDVAVGSEAILGLAAES
jgi:peroxiredoxin